MNDALREAQAVDPKWARSEQRKLWLLKGITAAVILALAVGTVSFVVGLHNSTEITHVEKTVEHSACQEAPAGDECQKAKAESAEAANLRVTCISFFKAGYPCPKPGSTAAGRAARRQSLRAHPVQGATSAPTQSEGGDAASAPTGHSLPSRHEGGSSGSHGAPAPGNGGSDHAPVPGEGGNEAAPAPGTPAAPAPTAPSSPGASSPPSTEPPTETPVVEGAPAPEAPVRQGAGALLESVGGVVEETGATVNDVVGGVRETTCSLAKVLCP